MKNKTKPTSADGFAVWFAHLTKSLPLETPVSLLVPEDDPSERDPEEVSNWFSFPANFLETVSRFLTREGCVVDISGGPGASKLLVPVSKLFQGTTFFVPLEVDILQQQR